MATVQFKTPSPYTISVQDTSCQKYEADFKLNSMNNTERYGFALFGVGRIGTIHLKSLLREPKIDLLYIVEKDETKWTKVKNYWNLKNTQFITVDKADIVYGDPKIKAVVVASPTDTHEEIVKNTLDNNKAVFCEKPIAYSIEQVKACYDKARKMNLPLLSAFNSYRMLAPHPKNFKEIYMPFERRFDPSYQSVQKRVRAGEIGHILTVKVCSRDSPLPPIEFLKTSGGIFHDCAVHDIDMILYVLGEYPSKVSVVAKANIPEIAAIDDFDNVAILLSFDNGAIATIDLSRHCTYGYDQRLEVFGQKGMIKVENQQPFSNVETYTNQSVSKSPILYSFASRNADGYENEMRHFIDVLEGKAKLCIDPMDTLAVSKIADACEKAARTGKFVELKWTKEELPLTQQ